MSTSESNEASHRIRRVCRILRIEINNKLVFCLLAFNWLKFNTPNKVSFQSANWTKKKHLIFEKQKKNSWLCANLWCSKCPVNNSSNREKKKTEWANCILWCCVIVHCKSLPFLYHVQFYGAATTKIVNDSWSTYPCRVVFLYASPISR